jgi:hypothetical protein
MGRPLPWSAPHSRRECAPWGTPAIGQTGGTTQGGRSTVVRTRCGGRPSTSFALPGYPRSRKNRGHSGGPRSAPRPYFIGSTPGSDNCPEVGRRMERGRACVERNRSERAKIASVAEWKPPAPIRASRRWGTPAGKNQGGTSTEAQCSLRGMDAGAGFFWLTWGDSRVSYCRLYTSRIPEA